MQKKNKREKFTKSKVVFKVSLKKKKIAEQTESFKLSFRKVFKRSYGSFNLNAAKFMQKCCLKFIVFAEKLIEVLVVISILLI
ncbi:hypothetical protein DOY81_007735 [Sarcophaga bullata]|nr:hypothetical protein DOY81_007735 [Sarcophaga bullata]